MKKIIFISVFVFALIGFTFYSVNVSADTVQPVNTCLDGIDNDDNTLVDEADPSCDGSSTYEGAAPTTPANPENTYALCTDGLDNNDNTLIDGTDPACSEILAAVAAAENNSNSGSNPPSNNPENTYALCTDGLDNNDNTLIDAADPACDGVQAPTTPTTPTQPTGPTGGSSQPTGPIFGNSGGFVSGGFSGITSGTPISATGMEGINPNCKQLFTTSMKVGKVNNKKEVIRLQAFLNKNLGLKLAVTGKYDAQTASAVSMFQLKYKDSVLTPWGLTVGTGVFHQTTRRQVNLLVCPAEAPTAMPVLVPLK